MGNLAFRSEADRIRFMQKVHIREDGCWEWKAARFSKGYGQFTIGDFNHRAHRVSHWNFNGPFDTDMDVMHSCDREWCVCPDHLSGGTNTQNRQDSVFKERHNIGERNGNASLTEEKVREMRVMFDSGFYTKAEISRKFKISPSVVGGVVERKSWNHVR